MGCIRCRECPTPLPWRRGVTELAARGRHRCRSTARAHGRRRGAAQQSPTTVRDHTTRPRWGPIRKARRTMHPSPVPHQVPPSMTARQRDGGLDGVGLGWRGAIPIHRLQRSAYVQASSSRGQPPLEASRFTTALYYFLYYCSLLLPHNILIGISKWIPTPRSKPLDTLTTGAGNT